MVGRGETIMANELGKASGNLTGEATGKVSTDFVAGPVAGLIATDRLFAGATVLCDGAMGTMLYARGVFINRFYDELNLSQPEMVREVHAEYLQAGAEVVETNTFGANAFRLEMHGLKDKGREINRAGVRLGRGGGGNRFARSRRVRGLWRERLGRWECGWSPWVRSGWMRLGRRSRSRSARWWRVGRA